MINFKYPIKLTYKLIIGAVLAFFTAAILFIVMQGISSKLIHIYTSDPQVILRHQQKKVSDLQRYIFDHKLYLADYAQIDSWVNNKDLTIISIYHKNNLIYDSSKPYNTEDFIGNIEIPPLPGQKLYTISFEDEKVKVAISDLFHHRYQDYTTYLNLAIFFLVFISIMLIFIKKKVAYITILEGEIKVLEGGSLDHTITVKGNDELSLLAQGIEEMRRAFVDREKYTQDVKKASNEVMAAISHDLRTPLTTLIGYLDIVVMGANMENEKQQYYLNKSKERAYQLKSLIHNLFEYFFVSTKTKEQLAFTVFTDVGKLDKMIQDHLLFLEEYGFQSENKITNDSYAIELHLDFMQRLFDNLFSNIHKYGNPSFPIKIINYIHKGQMVIELRNKILENPQVLESTGLGLKTCEKIMYQHKGNFITEKCSSEFIVKLIFPIL